MITDKETNIVYFSKILETDSRFSDTYIHIAEILDLFGVKKKLLPDTKDIWARDYMPIQISVDKFIEYRYDPDYLQGTRKGYRDLKTYPDIVCKTIKLKTKKTNIILDGGNIVKSKDCIILTDKIIQENRLICDKNELIKRLRRIFEVDKIVLIPWDTLEEFGHSDDMLRFIDDSTVLVNEIYKSDKRLIGQLKRNGIETEWLKFTVKKRDKRNWAYINFLQTKDFILLPKFNIEEDEQAFEQIKKYFPEYAENERIAQVDMTEIIKYKGALNCITWTIQEKI